MLRAQAHQVYGPVKLETVDFYVLQEHGHIHVLRSFLQSISGEHTPEINRGANTFICFFFSGLYLVMPSPLTLEDVARSERRP